MGIAVADEATTLGRLIDGGLEDPEVLLGAAQSYRRLYLYPSAAILDGQPQQVGMGDIFRGLC